MELEIPILQTSVEKFGSGLRRRPEDLVRCPEHSRHPSTRPEWATVYGVRIIGPCWIVWCFPIRDACHTTVRKEHLLAVRIMACAVIARDGSRPGEFEELCRRKHISVIRNQPGWVIVIGLCERVHGVPAGISYLLTPEYIPAFFHRRRTVPASQSWRKMGCAWSSG